MTSPANGYSSRADLWLLVTGLPLGVALQLLLLPHFDPKRRLKAHSLNYLKLGLTVVGLLGGLLAYALYAAVHPGTDASRGMMVLTGLFLAAMGNYLTTVPPNYFVGIRTP